MAEAQRPKTSVYVPVSTLSVDSKILDIKLKKVTNVLPEIMTQEHTKTLFKKAKNINVIYVTNSLHESII